MSGVARKKIAVLGGGVGAMTAVYHLTNPPDWQEKYDITVYQVGWRLGGKGASGRGEYGRIEEHGLHMWYGFYENAFKMIQTVYKELDRPRGTPLSTWEEAFKPQNFTVYQEYINGRWLHWPMTLGSNNATPGEGGVFPTPAEMITMLLEDMVYTLVQAEEPEGSPIANTTGTTKDLSWWQKLAQNIENSLEKITHKAGILLLIGALKVAQGLEDNASLGHGSLHALLEQFQTWLHSLLENDLLNDDNMRRLFIMLDLTGTIARGLIADNVRDNGLASLNELDFMVWLKKHGVDTAYTLPFVDHNFYDQAFAFEDGDCRKPNFAAGVVLYAAMRTYFTYKGAMLWKMQAGMGDTIFGPIYELLKRRGVKFCFFHQVQSLHVQGSAINKITVQVQATVKAGPDAYNPFVIVKGLPCWPSQPNFEQLAEGEVLKNQQIDLESYWTPWAGVAVKELAAGRDYDQIIFGISLGAVPYICQELMAAQPAWQAMVQHVKTIQTQAFQLWLKPDDAGLGWPMWRQQAATLTGYDVDDDPDRAGLDTWGDFSHLIIREEWPSDNFPNNIAYVCGAMKGVDGLHLPPPSDADFPAQQYQQAMTNSQYFLNNYVAHLWPRATLPNNPNGLDWQLVVSQFYRANIDPSERYVLCVADSMRYRLRPDHSLFANLSLAGDWTDNGLLSLGCVESAVWGGMQAANGVLTQFGYPAVEIIGWAE